MSKHENNSESNVTGCWIFTGSLNTDGYGQVSLTLLFNHLSHYPHLKRISLPKVRIAWTSSDADSRFSRRRIQIWPRVGARLKPPFFYIDWVTWQLMGVMPTLKSHISATTIVASILITYVTKLRQSTTHEKDVPRRLLAQSTIILWWIYVRINLVVFSLKEKISCAVCLWKRRIQWDGPLKLAHNHRLEQVQISRRRWEHALRTNLKEQSIWMLSKTP